MLQFFFWFFKSTFLSDLEYFQKKIRGVDSNALETYSALWKRRGGIKPLLGLAVHRNNLELSGYSVFKCTMLIISFSCYYHSQFRHILYVVSCKTSIVSLEDFVHQINYFISQSLTKQNSLNFLMTLYLLLVYRPYRVVISCIILPVTHYLNINYKNCEVER